MHKIVIAALGAASLLTVPALAETGNTAGSAADNSSANTPGSPGKPQTTATQPSSATTESAPQDEAQDGMKMRMKITQDLQQDGFRDVRVAASSFLVHAVNRQGEPVVMIINPDSVFSVTQMNGAAGKPTTATQ